jgi:antibiotic biosynthesis monooxygenase (ABM) superfamily enzyme
MMVGTALEQCSIRVRAILTWLAIFPLVAVGMTITAPFTSDWHPVLRSLVLTLIVVPLAAYLVMPRLLALHQRLRWRPLTR